MVGKKGAELRRRMGVVQLALQELWRSEVRGKVTFRGLLLR